MTREKTIANASSGGGKRRRRALLPWSLDATVGMAGDGLVPLRRVGVSTGCGFLVRDEERALLEFLGGIVLDFAVESSSAARRPTEQTNNSAAMLRASVAARVRCVCDSGSVKAFSQSVPVFFSISRTSPKVS